MSPSESNDERVDAPLEKTARSIAEPLVEFVNTQSASGWVLLAATVVAVGLANSIWGLHYFEFIHLELGVSFAGERIAMSLQHWVNDGLMAFFFFLLGLELKRELLVGRLKEFKPAASVLCAAIGGIVLPALLFLSISESAEVRDGWAIPVATDTAFALMVLVLLGDRIPSAARAFLVGLAIVDDLGAILIIAFAYTSELNTALWLPIMLTLGFLITLNLVGVRNGLVYLLTGCVLWWLLTRVGLHGTLTGVIVALAAPVRPALPRPTFIKQLKRKVRLFEKEQDSETDSILEQPKQQQLAHDVLKVAEKATTPLNRWETRLGKPISFLVMPLFAFMNAGVLLTDGALQNAWNSDLSWAIFGGLLLGKPVGIMLGIWLGTSTGLAALPKDLTWRHVLGIGVLGGIGFTMSLFIATLSFGANTGLLAIAKQAVMVTSLCAGLLGYAWLRWGCDSS